MPNYKIQYNRVQIKSNRIIVYLLTYYTPECYTSTFSTFQNSKRCIIDGDTLPRSSVLRITLFLLIIVLYFFDLHFYQAVKCDGSPRVRHIIFISSQRFPLRVHTNREIMTLEGVSRVISIWQYGL